MATYQVLYWKEFPAQIKVEDNGEDINEELAPRFQELIDQVASDREITGTDEYLDGWNWGDPEDRPGTAREVLDAIKKELEEKFPEQPQK